ncbi:C-type lectin domain family 4 member E-like [Clarias gariepinus]
MRGNVHANSRHAADLNGSYENMYVKEVAPEMRVTRSHKRSMTSGPNTVGGRYYILRVVCLVLLCVLLLAAITVLWVKFNNLKTENSQLQTKLNNLTVERDQLQNSYNIATFKDTYINLGWRGFNSSLYYISTENKDWEKSRQDCRERGADLAVVNSKGEQEFINKLLCIRVAWIGLSDIDKEGEWKWVDDTTPSTRFWGRGEPNSYAGDEDCATTGYMTDPIWNWADYPCNSEFMWICEKAISK